MKKIVCVFSLLVITLISILNADTLTLKEAQEAVCRITCDESSIGTGTVFQEDEYRFYILTNAHVVDGCKDIKIQFFEKVDISEKFLGILIFKRFDKKYKDLAIITVNKILLGKLKPRIIPLAPKLNFEKDTYLFGSGFPAGRWLQSWQGKILFNHGEVFEINMPPHGGQSGTAVLANIGEKTYIIGILSIRVDNLNFEETKIIYSRGLVVSLNNIYKMLEEDTVIDELPEEATEK